MFRALLVLALFAGCSREPERVPPSAPAEAPEPREEAAADVRAGGPWDEELTLEEEAHDTPGPSVLVHAPPGFDPAAPLDLVVFLHGWSGCARVLAHTGEVPCADEARRRAGWGLNDAFDATGSTALFVVPQLAWLERDGAAGRFAERDGFARFVSAMLRALAPRLGERGLAQLRRVTLLPHSAGFETALAIVQRGGVPIDHVVLFDALYRGVDPFAAWVVEQPSRRLVSLYTGMARTASQSRRLGLLARSTLTPEAVAVEVDQPLAEQLCAHRVVVARAHAPHADVPARYLGEVMEGLESERSGVCSRTP